MPLAADIVTLYPAEHLDQIEQRWDSLAVTPGALPLTSAQHEELDRRLDALDAEGPSGTPWDEVMQRIRSRNL